MCVLLYIIQSSSSGIVLFPQLHMIAISFYPFCSLSRLLLSHADLLSLFDAVYFLFVRFAICGSIKHKVAVYLLRFRTRQTIRIHIYCILFVCLNFEKMWRFYVSSSHLNGAIYKSRFNIGTLFRWIFAVQFAQQRLQYANNWLITIFCLFTVYLRLYGLIWLIFRNVNVW